MRLIALGCAAATAGVVMWRREERLRAAVRAAEERFRQSFDGAPTGMVAVSAAGMVEHVNVAFAAMLGAEPRELEGLMLIDELCVPFEDGTLPALAKARGEWRFRHQLGGVVWALVGVTSVRVADHHQWFLQAQDLTDRRQAEARFRGLLEASPGALVGTAADGTVLLANSGAERLFGVLRDDLIGRSVTRLVPHSQRPRLVTAIERTLNDIDAPGAPHELHAQRGDGALFPVEIRLSPLHSGDAGTLIALTATDLTDRRRTEEILRHLAGVFASTDEAIVTATPSGVIRAWNPAAERLYGYAESDAIGQPLFMLVPHEDTERERELIDRVVDGERVHERVRRLRSDGNIVDVELSACAATDALGRFAGLTLVSHLAPSLGKIKTL